MILFYYLIALIPMCIGCYLWWRNKEVVWFEWIIGTALAFALSGIVHWVSVSSMTNDHESISGRVTATVFYPEWTEMYTVQVPYSCGKNQTCYRTEVRFRTHYEEWEAVTTLRTFNISESHYEDIKKKFGNKIDITKPYKGGFVGGDPNVYTVQNRTDYMYPVNLTQSFENRIKAAPSVFSFPKVPEDVKVFDYPENDDWSASDRLLGTAKDTIGIYEFDSMNAKVGPHKKANVVMIGFKDQPANIAQWQEAKYIGGKKNDIVICYGVNGDNLTSATWSYVFGWTEKSICKKNLESIILTNPVNNSILPKIEQEIFDTYEIKDWSKFDYITVEPPFWVLILLIFLMIITQSGFWYWVHCNGVDKCDSGKSNFNRNKKYNFYIR